MLASLLVPSPLLPRVDKKRRLVLPSLLEEFFVVNLVHSLISFGRLLRDTNKLLLEATRSIGGVEGGETLVLISPEEGGDILKIGGSRRPDERSVLVRLPHSPNGPRDDTFESRTTLIMKKVNPVNYGETHKARVIGVCALPRDYISFLLSHDKDMFQKDLCPDVTEGKEGVTPILRQKGLASF